jgi:flagellar biosynthetic protein FliQ
MTEQMVIQVVRDAFYHVLLIVGPLLLVSLVVGLFIAILQAATTVSEQTLTFVPKLLAVFIVIVLLLPYMIKTLKAFFFEIMNMISSM